MGIQVLTEALRIPSTKNMAQVGERVVDAQSDCAGEEAGALFGQWLRNRTRGSLLTAL
jgi:hypothetical protein